VVHLAALNDFELLAIFQAQILLEQKVAALPQRVVHGTLTADCLALRLISRQVSIPI
jgi:hypothetical protein